MCRDMERAQPREPRRAGYAGLVPLPCEDDAEASDRTAETRPPLPGVLIKIGHDTPIDACKRWRLPTHPLEESASPEWCGGLVGSKIQSGAPRFPNWGTADLTPPWLAELTKVVSGFVATERRRSRLVWPHEVTGAAPSSMSGPPRLLEADCARQVSSRS